MLGVLTLLCQLCCSRSLETDMHIQILMLADNQSVFIVFHWFAQFASSWKILGSCLIPTSDHVWKMEEPLCQSTIVPLNRRRLQYTVFDGFSKCIKVVQETWISNVSSLVLRCRAEENIDDSLWCYAGTRIFSKIVELQDFCCINAANVWFLVSSRVM